MRNIFLCVFMALFFFSLNAQQGREKIREKLTKFLEKGISEKKSLTIKNKIIMFYKKNKYKEVLKYSKITLDILDKGNITDQKENSETLKKTRNFCRYIMAASYTNLGEHIKSINTIIKQESVENKSKKDIIKNNLLKLGELAIKIGYNTDAKLYEKRISLLEKTHKAKNNKKSDIKKARKPEKKINKNEEKKNKQQTNKNKREQKKSDIKKEEKKKKNLYSLFEKKILKKHWDKAVLYISYILIGSLSIFSLLFRQSKPFYLWKFDKLAITAYEPERLLQICATTKFYRFIIVKLIEIISTLFILATICSLFLGLGIDLDSPMWWNYNGIFLGIFILSLLGLIYSSRNRNFINRRITTIDAVNQSMMLDGITFTKKHFKEIINFKEIKSIEIKETSGLKTKWEFLIKGNFGEISADIVEENYNMLRKHIKVWTQTFGEKFALRDKL